MLAEFGDEILVRQTFQEASGALGYDLWQLVQEGPAEALNETDKTQPALLAASVALWRLWQHRGGTRPSKRPSMLAGHSLGEYSALCCAGVLILGDAIRLVEKRGRLMQEAVPAGSGGMAAVIGLDDGQVVAACEQAAQGEVVAAVNFNAPGQVVIAGARTALERAISACKEAGARRALPLPVSVPSHCALMRPAADKLAEELAGVNFNTPEVPVINNVDVAIETEPARIRDALVRQLYQPVRWVEVVKKLAADGVVLTCECGPGRVLGGLIKRIDDNLPCLPLDTEEALHAAISGE
jgi:[acyl-carrier-protein] S-malonyltransferase